MLRRGDCSLKKIDAEEEAKGSDLQERGEAQEEAAREQERNQSLYGEDGPINKEASAGHGEKVGRKDQEEMRG